MQKLLFKARLFVDKSEKVIRLYPVNKLLLRVQYSRVIWYFEVSEVEVRVWDLMLSIATDEVLKVGFEMEYPLTPDTNCILVIATAKRVVFARLFKMALNCGYVSVKLVGFFTIIKSEVWTFTV